MVMLASFVHLVTDPYDAGMLKQCSFCGLKEDGLPRVLCICMVIGIICIVFFSSEAPVKS